MEAFLQWRRLRHHVEQEASKKPARGLEASSSHETLEGRDRIQVEFHTPDPNDPRQWSPTWKTVYIAIIWLMVFITGWSSSADATAHGKTAKAFHVSEVAESLATSMYLFGVAFGAVLAGPCSESVGRLPVYLASFFLYLIWTFASALSPNFGAQIVFRGFAGIFASASMSIYGGSLADLLETDARAKVWPVFALSPLLGPSVAPIANGWITQNLGWRWVDWMTLILSGAVFALAFLFLPETSSSVILWSKASWLRKVTEDERYQSDMDTKDGLLTSLQTNLVRIVHFITLESTTVLFGLYLTVLYALVFGFLEGFDYIYTDTYGFDIGQRYSAFAAITVGILVGLPYNLTFALWGANKPGVPEYRLRPALFASPLLAMSLFWIGWTNRPNISDWSSLGACCLFGFSLMSLFTPTYHYLLDTYGTLASSALAAITFVRYLASGGMVLATEPLYKALSVRWMLTLLGCVAAVLALVPWVFWAYGPRIRERSKWAHRPA